MDIGDSSKPVLIVVLVGFANWLHERGSHELDVAINGRQFARQRWRDECLNARWFLWLADARAVGALRLTVMVAPMVLDGPMTGEWFLAYTEQVLVPTLQPGDIVILDIPAHKAPPFE